MSRGHSGRLDHVYLLSHSESLVSSRSCGLFGTLWVFWVSLGHAGSRIIWVTMPHPIRTGGTLQRKDVVNHCLEFGGNAHGTGRHNNNNMFYCSIFITMFKVIPFSFVVVFFF